MHIPVLKKEVLDCLAPKSNEDFIDCTIGQGGHSNDILEKTGPHGRLLGIDLDPKQIENCAWLEEKFGERIILINDSYANLKNIIADNDFANTNGILLDVGFSSFQTDESKKGFSFLRDEKLDMRYNAATGGITASNIVNNWDEKGIERILEQYGEEKFAKKIAKEIVAERKNKKIESTFQLVEIIQRAVPAKFQHAKIHCATRTFQAIRIAVNGELDSLQNVLPQATEALQRGGRLAVISFHSLEDRIVKEFFKQEEQNQKIKILTKKPVIAPEWEVAENPRSRSAKLRAIIKI